MALNIVDKIKKNVKINNVLISLSDKNGLEYLIESLLKINRGILFYSTGGTYESIKKIIGTKNLVAVSEYTGQPEMQGGLVKTLDFKIYMGLLSETFNSSHQMDLKRINAVNFDMTVVNLYPFSKTISLTDCTLEMGRTNIDIGGPCMLRASAKNFLRVLPICDPEDYRSIINELEENSGEITFKTRYEMAKKAFNHTAEYDKNISDFLIDSDFDSIKKCYTEGDK